jgi:hypothetical protein
MVAIGGIADIVQHWHEMARSRMTQSGHETICPQQVCLPAQRDVNSDCLIRMSSLTPGARYGAPVLRDVMAGYGQFIFPVAVIGVAVPELTAIGRGMFCWRSLR